jgi:hypothetical protein
MRRGKISVAMSRAPFALLAISCLVALSACAGPDRLDQVPPKPTGRGLSVRIDVPDDGVWSIFDRHSHLDVIFENTSDQPISIYDPTTGFSGFMLYWRTDTGKGMIFRDPKVNPNSPLTQLIQLSPGEQLTAPVEAGPLIPTGTPTGPTSRWVGWPPNMDGQKITFWAVYVSNFGHSPPPPNPPLWHGTAVSNPVTITVYDHRQR